MDIQYTKLFCLRYPADLQSAPVFSLIGARGIFFYKLFQLFQCDEVDGTGASNVPHPMKSLVIGGPGPWVPFNSNSFLTYLGPDIYMLLLDCRTERKKEKIVSDLTYQGVFDAVRRLPDRVNHVVLLTGVPIAYPRYVVNASVPSALTDAVDSMVFVESFLASKMNPLILLGKSGVAGFTGLVNRMNKDAELLDDLNDHCKPLPSLYTYCYLTGNAQGPQKLIRKSVIGSYSNYRKLHSRSMFACRSFLATCTWLQSDGSSLTRAKLSLLMIRNICSTSSVVRLVSLSRLRLTTSAKDITQSIRHHLKVSSDYKGSSTGHTRRYITKIQMRTWWSCSSWTLTAPNCAITASWDEGITASLKSSRSLV